MLEPWNAVALPEIAAALPEIMVEDVQDGKLNVREPHPESKAAGQHPGSAAGGHGWGLAGKQARCARVMPRDGKAAGQQPGSVAGARGRGAEKPNRGLTFEFSGARLFARPLERFVSPPFFGEKLSDLKRKGHSDF